MVGAVAALISLFLRRSLKETSSEEMRENKDAGSIMALFRNHKAAFITVLGYTAGGSLIFYTFTTYMQKYLVNTAGLHAKTASYIMTGALFLYMCMQPLFGMLADKIGRRNSMLWFGALGALCTVPILLTLKSISSPFLAFVLITLALAIVSFYTSISGLVKAEMFPPEVRALGVEVGLRGGQCDFWRLGGVRCLEPEGPGHGEHFLLVCHGDDGGGVPVQPAPAQAAGVFAPRPLTQPSRPWGRRTQGLYMSERPGNQLFDAYFTARDMREVFCDAGRVQAMLDVEAALARAEARVGLIPGMRWRRSRTPAVPSCTIFRH